MIQVNDLVNMELDEPRNQDNPCEGCIYSVENDCGQGSEYGKPTNCYED